MTCCAWPTGEPGAELERLGSAGAAVACAINSLAFVRHAQGARGVLFVVAPSVVSPFLASAAHTLQRRLKDTEGVLYSTKRNRKG